MFNPWIEAAIVIAGILIGLIPQLSNDEGPWTGRNKFFEEKRRRSHVENKQNITEGRMIEFGYRFVGWFTNRRLYLIVASLAILAVLLPIIP